MADNQEGKKLTDKEAAGILSKALSFLLRDQEGIFVEFPEGQFIVSRVDGGIFIDDRNNFRVAFGDGVFIDGGMVWLHETQEEAKLAAMFEGGDIVTPPTSVKSTVTH
jgi:hypothetical protein